VSGRAAITGIGAVTPLGVGVAPLHERWARGECAIEDGTATCRDFDPGDVLSRKESRRMHRSVQLAIMACDEAVSMAWGGELPYAPERVACVLGVAFGGTELVCEQYLTHEQSGADAVWTLTVPVGMGNAAPAVLAIRHGFRGSSGSVTSACAASAQAIGDGLRMLREDVADAVIVGGTEAPVTDFLQAAFLQAGALSPTGVSRPFDGRRDGFVMGEGSGILVLEREDRALARRANVLGHLAGFASTTDGYHLTAPDVDGAMCAAAIRGALDDAGVGVEDVAYVNAHGTSTRSNDRAETAALKRALGDHAYRVPISAPKSVLGHSIGAAGAIEAIATLQALRYREAQPTVGLEQPEDGLDLAYVTGGRATPLPESEDGRPLVGISNSFAFGGHNATLVVTA
jgi:3-oxoacyl-[acyl-carrier-protein] synthase II